MWPWMIHFLLLQNCVNVAKKKDFCGKNLLSEAGTIMMAPLKLNIIIVHFHTYIILSPIRTCRYDTFACPFTLFMYFHSQLHISNNTLTMLHTCQKCIEPWLVNKWSQQNNHTYRIMVLSSFLTKKNLNELNLKNYMVDMIWSHYCSFFSWKYSIHTKLHSSACY